MDFLHSRGTLPLSKQTLQKRVSALSNCGPVNPHMVQDLCLGTFHLLFFKHFF